MSIYLVPFLHLRKAIYRRFCLPIRAEEKRNGRMMMGTEADEGGAAEGRRGTRTDTH